MPKQTIDQVEVSGKRVLMRVDFNVPVTGGSIDDDRRIRLALPSIRSVLDRAGRLVLMSHMGRPKGVGYEESESLAICAQRLSDLLGAPVGFPSTDCVDAQAAAAVDALADGEVLLLENLRFHKAEKSGDPGFASRVAAFGDVYCNEAFGTSHRTDASMYAVPMQMEGKPRVAGLLLTKEITFLSESLNDPERPFTAVLGGAKVADKIPTIEHLIQKTDYILIGGAMAYTFLQAMGRKVGRSRVEADRLDDAERILELAARESCELRVPRDHVCSTEFSESAGDVKVFEDSIPDGYMGLDIGARTQDEYRKVISDSKTVVWNGPMGVFEWAPFRDGTQQVALAIADATTAHGALTIVGGGDSASAAERFGVADKVSHVSTGGGASLEMLSGKPFPTLDVLDESTANV